MLKLLTTLFLLLPVAASAVELKLDGYGDVRLVVPPDEKSYLDGGLGKFRFGSSNGSAKLEWTELIGEVSARFTPGLTAVVVARAAPNQTKAMEFQAGRLLSSYFARKHRSRLDLAMDVDALRDQLMGWR